MCFYTPCPCCHVDYCMLISFLPGQDHNDTESEGNDEADAAAADDVAMMMMMMMVGRWLCRRDREEHDDDDDADMPTSLVAA